MQVNSLFLKTNSMKILIETKNLIDFPYDKEHDQMFMMNESKINNLVSEILYASPTCYLVSGYRGAGKTSFIKKVQHQCKEAITNNGVISAKPKSIIFVYSSFSKYETQTNFLRKIIRDLEETIRSDKIKTTDNVLKADLTTLNEKTFKSIEEEYTETEEKENTTEYSLDITEYIMKMFQFFSPILIPYLSEIIFSIPCVSENAMPWARGMIYMGSLLWFGVNSFNFTKKYSIKKNVSNKISEKSITDDDIINYSLERLIDKFIQEGHKLVFVLDELDKVDDDDFDKLLKEMKPWLVRGKADFIIVAGQKLTMKYYQLRDRDDEMLASLFSKVIHINLLQEYHFDKLFNDFLCKGVVDKIDGNAVPRVLDELTEPEKEQLMSMRSSYIYRSKRLPRTFFNLLRQDLQWNNDKAFIDSGNNTYDIENSKLKALKKIFDTINIDASLSETIRDHFIMQLFFIASTIEGKSISSTPQKISLQDFIQPIVPQKMSENDNSNQYQYQNLLPKLKLYLEDFYYAAYNEKLIDVPDDTKNAEMLTSDLTSNFTTKNEDKIYDNSDLNLPNLYSPIDKKSHSENDSLLYAVITGEEPTKLDKFKNEFFDFFFDLKQFYSLSPNRNTNENVGTMTFGKLLSHFQHILQLQNLNDIHFDKDFEFYRTRRDENGLFKSLEDSLHAIKFKFSPTYYKLLEQHVQYTLQSVFKKANSFFNYNGLTVSEKEFAQYKILNEDQDFKKVTVFCRYQYIEGIAKISSEEIGRAIDFLDEMNIESQQGNYLLVIIFQSNNASDNKMQELNAAVELKRIRPEFTSKIFYIILSRSSFGILETEIKSIQERIVAYTILPELNQNEAISKSRKYKIHSSANNQNTFDPDDPNKGRFGGDHERQDRVLSADVTESKLKEGWYNLDLTLRSTNSKNPLTGKVIFYLHPTFTPDKVVIIAKNGKAELKNLLCYEAFTVGAVCNNNSIRLELDLNNQQNVPEKFRHTPIN